MGQQTIRCAFLRRIFKFQRSKRRQAVSVPRSHEDQNDVPGSRLIESPGEEQYQPNSKLMSIPLDLLRMVFYYLETEDCIAFSLACEGLYDSLFFQARQRFASASPDQKRRVQTMLEKDLKYIDIYCPFCEIFHTWNDKRYREINCVEKDEIQSTTFAATQLDTRLSQLSYLDARMIVNAVIFNKSYSLGALGLLRRHFIFGTPRCLWSQSWWPKVIDGELILSIASKHMKDSTGVNEDDFAFRGGGLGLKHGRLGDLRSPFESRWKLAAGEGISPDSSWIEGHSMHITDHEGWGSKLEGLSEEGDWTAHGSVSKTWEDNIDRLF
ncbi:hypothetical protein J7T55_009743 [Diaporthe amygdali]|uniref:uncharacterized protein n=1 Tax=Phomopsis amygdali TaxID=1214568 RepID=UPI0022FE22DE|nr:uncharacterized protein J7T55_009743 [Diaporthe amygdali]KAJ0116593.1 hypothetical protein J7T55_009743 [Diaporthe amygdali]